MSMSLRSPSPPNSPTSVNAGQSHIPFSHLCPFIFRCTWPRDSHRRYCCYYGLQGYLWSWWKCRSRCVCMTGCDDLTRTQSFVAIFSPLWALKFDSYRSVMDGSSRNSSSMAVKMLSRGARGPTGLGQTIVVNVPYIRSDIPILVLFRALGFVADKDILEHIVYNFEDVEMMEALRPSIEEAFPVQDQNVRHDTSSSPLPIWFCFKDTGFSSTTRL